MRLMRAGYMAVKALSNRGESVLAKEIFPGEPSFVEGMTFGIPSKRHPPNSRRGFGTTTRLFEVVVSQLLNVLLVGGVLLWGGHGWLPELNPAWPDHPRSTTDLFKLRARAAMVIATTSSLDAAVSDEGTPLIEMLSAYLIGT